VGTEKLGQISLPTLSIIRSNYNGLWGKIQTHTEATKEPKYMQNKLISDRLFYSLFDMRVKLQVLTL